MTRTNCMDVRNDHTHCTSIQHLLDEPVATLVWHTDKRRDPCLDGSDAQLADVTDRQDAMFHIDEERVVASCATYLHDLGSTDEFDA